MSDETTYRKRPNRPWFEAGFQELDDLLDENPRTCIFASVMGIGLMYFLYKGWQWFY